MEDCRAQKAQKFHHLARTALNNCANYNILEHICDMLREYNLKYIIILKSYPYRLKTYFDT